MGAGAILADAAMTGKFEHYLVSVTIPGLLSQEAYLHCYIMARDQATVLRAISYAMDLVEKKFEFKFRAPISLQTHLNADGKRQVRELVNKLNPKDRNAWNKAKDMHLSSWIMPNGDPDNERLMELH